MFLQQPLTERPHMPNRRLIAMSLSLLCIGCAGPRYVFLSEHVAAAGAAGANTFSTPETETIRGHVIRLDTQTGAMVVVPTEEKMTENAKGELGFLSFRVFSPEESRGILSPSTKKQSELLPPP